jgi:hypothetical protein
VRQKLYDTAAGGAQEGWTFSFASDPANAGNTKTSHKHQFNFIAAPGKFGDVERNKPIDSDVVVAVEVTFVNPIGPGRKRVLTQVVKRQAQNTKTANAQVRIQVAAVEGGDGTTPTPQTLTSLLIGATTTTVSLDGVPASGSISTSSIAGIAGGIGGVLCVAAAVTFLVWRRRKVGNRAVAPQAAQMVKSGAAGEAPPSQSQYANIIVREPEYDVGQVEVYSSARAFDDDNGADVYAKGHLTMN